MREISITGNLAADAEILTDKNGGNYIRFRMANREFSDPENETRWFDVTMFTIPRISQFLKKGAGVRVYGEYKDSLYQNDKYGAQINRNITAFKVDFWNGNGKRDEQDRSAQQKPQEAVTPKPEKDKVQKVTTTKAAKSTSSFVAPIGSDDDLPF